MPGKLLVTVGTLALLVALATATMAGEPARLGKKKITAADCERLVEQLANPNKPPFKESYAFPDDLDLRAIEKQQEKSRLAYNALSDNIEVALPVLFKHRSDRRFSYVYEDVGTSGVIVKASVGHACFAILREHIDVFARHVTKHDFASIPRCPSYAAICDLKKPGKECGDKTLMELQLEGIEWALRLEKPHLFESDKEWARARKSLKKMAEDIRASKKPILEERHLYPFGK